ncbi:threonine-phosphate decarboxylase CobD [Pseudomonas typographi]|uniref:threonine-phosphate decarboxylase n=1 Tax=Pseudomonas typographi TaxID=2715964 RepID=A0ABR7Z409_9PSED|nr:threonine-phosphate decarboxylase CobD [Pseudomonas typographi]MBD1586520.1 threonine-phosphate decarboxylase [Pseudomonas typographi]MBD1600021.1 threonine-phosphate decarboxylase [Pseudomonas typographi]
MLEHGGKLGAAAARFGIAREQWLDLSTGLAPWAFPIPTIAPQAWARLPEADDGLEAAARSYYNATQALPVAGSQAAIQALPRLRRPGRVGVLSPCYAEHAEAWRRGGHVVREIADAEVDYFLETLDVLVLVNPNNPTGRLLPPDQLLQWHARLSQRGGWLVVDEAFMDTTPALSLSPYSERPGLLVLRSFGKFFGLAGVRLGFALGGAPLLQLLAEQLGPWAVPGPTREVGRACLADTVGQQRQAQRSLAASERLGQLLVAHGLTPQGGCALFQWLSTAHALALYEHMGARGILLRLFHHDSSLRFGLPPDEAGFTRLAQALEAFAP